MDETMPDPFGDDDELEPEAQITEAAGWADTQGFHIDSEERMLWLQRKLAHIEMEISLVELQAARITGRLNQARQRYLERYGAEAMEFTRAQLLRMQKGKRPLKTWSTLYGDIQIRTTKEAAKVANPGAVWTALEEMKLLDEYKKESLDTTAVQKFAYAYMRESGVVLDGIEIVPEHEDLRFGFKSGTGGEDREQGAG